MFEFLTDQIDRKTGYNLVSNAFWHYKIEVEVL